MSLGRFLLLTDDSGLDISLHSVSFAETSVCFFGEVNFLGDPTGVLRFVEDVDVEGKVTTLSQFAFIDFFGEFREAESACSNIDDDCAEATFLDNSCETINPRNAFRHISERCGDKEQFFSGNEDLFWIGASLR